MAHILQSHHRVKHKRHLVATAYGSYWTNEPYDDEDADEPADGDSDGDDVAKALNPGGAFDINRRSDLKVPGSAAADEAKARAFERNYRPPGKRPGDIDMAGLVDVDGGRYWGSANPNATHYGIAGFHTSATGVNPYGKGVVRVNRRPPSHQFGTEGPTSIAAEHGLLERGGYGHPDQFDEWERASTPLQPRSPIMLTYGDNNESEERQLEHVQHAAHILVNQHGYHPSAPAVHFIAGSSPEAGSYDPYADEDGGDNDLYDVGGGDANLYTLGELARAHQARLGAKKSLFVRKAVVPGGAFDMNRRKDVRYTDPDEQDEARARAFETTYRKPQLTPANTDVVGMVDTAIGKYYGSTDREDTHGDIWANQNVLGNKVDEPYAPNMVRVNRRGPGDDYEDEGPTAEASKTGQIDSSTQKSWLDSIKNGLHPKAPVLLAGGTADGGWPKDVKQKSVTAAAKVLLKNGYHPDAPAVHLFGNVDYRRTAGAKEPHVVGTLGQFAARDSG